MKCNSMHLYIYELHALKLGPSIYRSFGLFLVYSYKLFIQYNPLTDTHVVNAIPNFISYEVYF